MNGWSSIATAVSRHLLSPGSILEYCVCIDNLHKFDHLSGKSDYEAGSNSSSSGEWKTAMPEKIKSLINRSRHKVKAHSGKKWDTHKLVSSKSRM